MARFPQSRNGLIHEEISLVRLGWGYDSSGYYEWLATPAVNMDFHAYQDYCADRFGARPSVVEGWNIYRPRNIQVEARDAACAEGNCNRAAVPGYSAHGGVRDGTDVFAADIAYQGVMSTAQHYEAAWATGWVPGEITEAISGVPGGEPWHINNYNPYRSVPAEYGISPTELLEKDEDDDMRAIIKAGAPDSGIIIQPAVPPYAMPKQVFDAMCGAYGLTSKELEGWQYDTVIREQWTAYSVAQQFASQEVTFDPGNLNRITEAVRRALSQE